MSKLYGRLDKKKANDLRILRDFISIYCRENHPAETRDLVQIKDERVRKALRNKDLFLCPDCSKLFTHGMTKLLLCPYDPKPTCKKCETHCYAPGYRENIRKVMRFSGPYFVKRGRLDMLFHYFR